MTPMQQFASGCLLAAAAAAASMPTSAQSLYKVENKWVLGGEGGWDYLQADPAAHRLYVTHGPRVEVLDTTTGKSAGAVTGLKATHGVALDPEGNFGYISDSGLNAVVVFDRKTFATVATIPAGTGPDGIVYEPVTKTIWSFNERSKDATVISAETRKVVATIALPGRPEYPVVDGTGQVFDNIEDKGTIVRLDAKSLKLTATWSLGGLESPSGLAIDVAGKRLFAVCDGKKMAVVDYTTGKLLAKPDIGDGPDAAGYDPKAKLAFASNGDGTLSIVDAGSTTYKTIQTLATEPRARTMAFDESNGRVYLVTAKFGPAPPPTAEVPRPRPAILPNSFTVLVVGR